jgi:hypothetical protein
VVTLPVHINVSKLALALLNEGRGVRFRGKFKLGEPATWRDMLLGKRD